MENRQHMKLKTAAVKLVGAIFILLLLVISLYPFIWMILNSFKENMEIFKQPFSLPAHWDFAVFRRGLGVWGVFKFHLGIYYRNCFSSCFYASGFFYGGIRHIAPKV